MEDDYGMRASLGDVTIVDILPSISYLSIGITFSNKKILLGGKFHISTKEMNAKKKIRLNFHSRLNLYSKPNIHSSDKKSSRLLRVAINIHIKLLISFRFPCINCIRSIKRYRFMKRIVKG